MGGGADESDPENPERDDLPKQQSGMSQSVQNDIGVCVVIILITVLAIIVTGKDIFCTLYQPELQNKVYL